MRIVATDALHISIDQLHLPGGIRRLALRYQRCHEVRGVLNGSDQAERMRAAQVLSERVAIGSVAGGLDLAIGRRLSHGHGAIVATETQAASDAQRGLRVPGLMVRSAVVGSVLRLRELLVPQRCDAA